MKYGNRVDANQQQIVKDLRKCGICSVAIIAPCGNGIPDLVIGFKDKLGRPVNILVEIKVDKAKLTPCEKVWHDEWQGQCMIARNTSDILQYICDMQKGVK